MSQRAELDRAIWAAEDKKKAESMMLVKGIAIGFAIGNVFMASFWIWNTVIR